MKDTAQIAIMGQHRVTAMEIKNDPYVTAEFIEYLRYLAELDPSMTLTAGQVWELFVQGFRIGTYWSEVTEDLKLPDPEWS